MQQENISGVIVANRIRALMKGRGVTQVQLAAAIGVTQPAVSGWLRGAVPDGRRLMALSDFFEVGMAYLLGVSEDRGADLEIGVAYQTRGGAPRSIAETTTDLRSNAAGVSGASAAAGKPRLAHENPKQPSEKKLKIAELERTIASMKAALTELQVTVKRLKEDTP